MMRCLISKKTGVDEMTNKQALVKELDEIVELATKQNSPYVR
jgi:hypothetical protein